ncbi:TolC family protein [Malonomonas rubra]|uniref:TolC family protein n=1 Tax=Malonomonas rubra TaxID=57040 RepID=UPI0026F24A5D|nr:TolC family protein [Malonomonas rubra]
MRFVKVSKKILVMLVLVVSFPVTSFAAGTQADQQLLDFSSVWQAALKQTPEMLLARARIGEAEAAVATAQGNILPRLNASYMGSATDNPLNVFGMKLTQGEATFNDFGAVQFNPSDPASLYIAPRNLNSPDWYDNYQSILKLQIPVYNGGKVREQVNQAKAYLATARHGDEMARQQLMLKVLKAYEGVRAANAFISVADKSVAAAQAYATLTDKLFARGVVSYNDQLRARLNLDSVRLRRSVALTNFDKACDGLRILAGFTDNIPMAVAGPVSIALPEESVVQLQKQMENGNPGLLALRNREEAAKAEVRIAQADYLPRFNIVLSQEWNAPNPQLGGNSASMIAGILSWDLFDFGVRKGNVAQARQRALQQTAERRRAANGLRLQLNAAWRDAHLAAESIKVRELAIIQAEEAERLERLRYEQGVSTMTELLLIQTQLDKARSDLIMARYQELMQRAGLLLALGQLTPAMVSEQP